MVMRLFVFLLISFFGTGFANAAVTESGSELLPEGEKVKSFLEIDMEERELQKEQEKIAESDDAETKKQGNVKEVKTEDTTDAVDNSGNGAEEQEEKLLSEKEKKLMLWRAQIAEERANETSRFKKKAIENTIKREKKYEEIMKRKEEKASRFQKAAMEKAEKEKQEEIKKKMQPSKSRFTEMAKKRAEERAKKREEKEKRLKRNQED